MNERIVPQTEMTWAELDAGNRQHYASRRRPEWLRNAEINRERGWAEHNSAIDGYLSLMHCVNQNVISVAWSKVERAERIAIALDEYASDCLCAWSAERDGPTNELPHYFLKHDLKDLIEARAKDIGVETQMILDNPGLLGDAFPFYYLQER